ncbi:MAG: DUF885 family protein [Bdellovibrionales bacterium]
MLRNSFLALIACASLNIWADTCGDFNKSVAKGTSAQRLNKFLDTQWKYLMREYPEWATFVGYPGQDNRWTDASPKAVERRRSENACQLKALKKISKAKLGEQDRINYDLNLLSLEQSLEADKFGADYMPVNHMNGFQTDTVQVLMAMRAGSIKGYQNILARLESLPELIEQNRQLMNIGMQKKLMPLKTFMPKMEQQISDLMPEDPEKSAFYGPFKEINSSLSAEDAAALRGKAKEILKSKVYPALVSFKKFLSEEYSKNGREEIAWTTLPNGRDWYAFLVRYHTTTDKTPDELHELGLKEVARIESEMTQIKDSTKFKGSLADFNKMLLKDKRFYYTNAEDLLAGYRDIAKRIDAELPKHFKTLPRMTYGVRPVAEFQAKTSPAAQYISGSPESGRPGWFEANTFDLPSRAKWEMETLTMHEAVPGHHFQISIAQELKGLPEFRKHGGFTAYVEGWALYAESLGKEMGFYKDPYSHYGHLSAEMMRAVRLVVDTGMHAKGWDKQKAWDFYRSKMPTSDVDSENEINRYITWPGQALAYKVGQLKIREIRTQAERVLGDKFDEREFHDEVLRHGALPMKILEKRVGIWVDKAKNQKAPAPTRISI